MRPEYQQTLRQNIHKIFELIDLKVITFDLDIDWEDLVGEEKREKIMSLITYLENQGVLSDLLTLLRRERPKITWDDPPISDPLKPPAAPVSLGSSRKYHSCFVSFSSQDQEFAERLITSLKAYGVRTWFVPLDMKIGARRRVSFDKNVLKKNKLLLILSRNSMESQKVETELAKEKEDQDQDSIFPIRVDNAILDRAVEEKMGWPAYISHICDFQHWKNKNEYQIALGRLLRDLQI